MNKSDEFQRTKMRKEMIIELLRNQGFRVTKQRQLLLEIILEGNCTSCKEIIYKASLIDKNIGAATVYRMINTLEDIGAINRGNMLKVTCIENEVMQGVCRVELEDDTVIELTPKKWNQIVQAGLSACGYADGQCVRKVSTNT